MKKVLLSMVFWAFAVAVPVPSMAGMDIHIDFPLPPPLVFPAPPEVIVLPDTPEVYVVPDVDADVFFWGGWWWRPWRGRWYRSHYYDRGWGYYDEVPDFYFDVDPGWRKHYKKHDWYGHRWRYERVPYRRLHKNWKKWDKDRYWERQKKWGVRGYKPRLEKERRELRRKRHEEYQRRPEVRKHQRERKERREKYSPRGKQRDGGSKDGRSRERDGRDRDEGRERGRDRR